MFTLFFNAKWALEVRFVIEKKRVNNSLLDLAAEAAVHDIMIEEEIEELDIPETLFEVVREKFRDVEWVRSFWSAKHEIGDESDNDLDDDNPDKEEEVQIPNENDFENEDAAQNVNEDFLASVMDELSSDVEHVVNGELEPDFEEEVSEVTNNIEQTEAKNNNGIDRLLSIWVFLFMLLGIFAYIWC